MRLKSGVVAGSLRQLMLVGWYNHQLQLQGELKRAQNPTGPRGQSPREAGFAEAVVLAVDRSRLRRHAVRVMVRKEALETQGYQSWFNKGKSADAVFASMQLLKAGSGLFNHPQFISWAQYADSLRNKGFYFDYMRVKTNMVNYFDLTFVWRQPYDPTLRKYFVLQPSRRMAYLRLD
ncbi:hypothetical protein GQ600_22413 [Phytophthora cactorum]|nr:hypothetical protein GQ600_22413 [Phytophthora cactorum]